MKYVPLKNIKRSKIIEFVLKIIINIINRNIDKSLFLTNSKIYLSNINFLIKF
jgi:hypothetical protein